MPKSIEKMAMLFPFVHMSMVAVSFFYFIKTLTASSFLLLVAVIYMLPLALWHLSQLVYPLKEGSSFIGIKESTGNPWLLAHNFQYLFITFSFFERVLILIPFAFSAWLRLWGSRIGKNVLWTPRVEVLDRTHLDIGDYCFIGDKTYLSSHLVRRKAGRLVLLVRRVEIGERALIGYQSQLLAGTRIPAQTQLPALSKALMGKIEKGVDGIKGNT